MSEKYGTEYLALWMRLRSVPGLCASARAVKDLQEDGIQRLDGEMSAAALAKFIDIFHSCLTRGGLGYFLCAGVLGNSALTPLM